MEINFKGNIQISFDKGISQGWHTLVSDFFDKGQKFSVLSKFGMNDFSRSCLDANVTSVQVRYVPLGEREDRISNEVKW